MPDHADIFKGRPFVVDRNETKVLLDRSLMPEKHPLRDGYICRGSKKDRWVVYVIAPSRHFGEWLSFRSRQMANAFFRKELQP